MPRCGERRAVHALATDPGALCILHYLESSRVRLCVFRRKEIRVVWMVGGVCACVLYECDMFMGSVCHVCGLYILCVLHVFECNMHVR